MFHVYALRVQHRDALQAYLKEKGIATVIHYPTALPFLEAYEHLGHTKEDFPVAHQCQQEFLSLPMYPELTQEQQTYVADMITRFYLERRYEKLQNRTSCPSEFSDGQPDALRQSCDEERALRDAAESIV